MKYRHSHHAGNFADVHKHVTLLALLQALKRKDKGFAYLETHAGRGIYDVSARSGEAANGIERLLGVECQADELRHYSALITQLREARRQSHAYPGSPWLAALQLRPQDRAVLCEILPAEARALEHTLESRARVRVERGDGFERLRAWLPPVERRALIFIDPPYEQSREDFDRLSAALTDGLHRFGTGVFAAWYPIKDERDTRHWHASLAASISHETLVGEMWLYPRDSRVALNGSGMVIVNPPFQIEQRMQMWLPELQGRLAVGAAGGTRVVTVAAAAAQAPRG